MIEGILFFFFSIDFSSELCPVSGASFCFSSGLGFWIPNSFFFLTFIRDHKYPLMIIDSHKAQKEGIACLHTAAGF